MSESLDRLWSDDRHWLAGRIYVCRDDPRLVVRGRRLFAFYTLNFAHKASYLVMLLNIVIIGGGLLVVKVMRASTTTSLITMFGAFAAVMLFQALLARSVE